MVKKINKTRHKPCLIDDLLTNWLIDWLKVWLIDLLIIRNGPKTPGWCRSQFLIPRHLTFAQDVRKQLVGICHNAGQLTFQRLKRKIYFLENSSFFPFFPPRTVRPWTCINSRCCYTILQRYGSSAASSSSWTLHECCTAQCRGSLCCPGQRSARSYSS